MTLGRKAEALEMQGAEACGAADLGETRGRLPWDRVLQLNDHLSSLQRMMGRMFMDVFDGSSSKKKPCEICYTCVGLIARQALHSATCCQGIVCLGLR